MEGFQLSKLTIVVVAVESLPCGSGGLTGNPGVTEGPTKLGGLAAFSGTAASSELTCK